MGDMTVAYPTTDIDVPHLDAVVTISCFSCGTHTRSREPFCAHCGSRVAVPVKAGTASVAATRSLQFAALGVLSFSRQCASSSS
jgi:primosomal protein N'